MTRTGLALTLAAAAVCGPVAAQAKPREEPTAVSPVTVMPPTLPPKVVATYPAEGQSIAPGVLVLKVTFDQKMDPRGFNYGAAPDGDQPDCVSTPRLLKDDKTFVLLCRVTSGKTFKVAFNAQRLGVEGRGGFANQAENPAEAHVLTFQVVRGDPVTTVPRAMAAAGLKDDEIPIQDDPSLTATAAN